MTIHKRGFPLLSASLGLLVLLTGCGNGGGGGSLPPTRPAGVVGGKAVDAVLVGSTIRAYEWDKGNIVSGVIAETTTDSAGHYSLDPSYKDAYLLLKATGGRYTEEATGTSVTLKHGQALTTLIRYESGKAITSHITVLTHWAACQAEWRALLQLNNNSDAVGLSNDVFSAMAGVAIREVEPLNITDPNNASPAVSAGLQYGLFPAAISSLTKELAEQSGQVPHALTSTTSIHLAQIGCNDIRADGKLDGQGYSADDTQITPLAFGTMPLTPQLYRNGVAQHMLKMASSPLNKTGLRAMDFLNIAQSLATMDASVFASLPPESVDLDGPLISINLPANTYIKGQTNLAFTIDDPLGISKVEYYVDGSMVDTGSAGNTTFSLNTQAYADGTHEIKVLAYDTLNNEGTFTRSFNFDNSGPVVTITSPLLVNNTTYLAMGTYQTDGTSVKTILVNGIAAALDTDNNTWSATVPLKAGRNELVIKAEDITGNLGPEVTVEVAVDTVKPVITNSNTNAYFSTGQNQFNLCNIGPIQQTNANALCIRDDRVSLSGQALSENLLSLSYVLIGYQASDAPVDGVFTLPDELLVQYKVNKDGALYQDWRTAPARNPLNSNWYLPLTMEYLGDTWYQTSINSTFTITIRATDRAGNSGEQPFSMRFDVLPSTITMNMSIPNESLLASTPFVSRFTVDSQDINIEYTYINDAPVGYYFYLENSNNSTVQHSYETAVRKNKARVKLTEEWYARWLSNTHWSGQPQLNEERTYSLMYNTTRQMIAPQIAYSAYENVASDTVSVNSLTSPSISTAYHCAYSDIASSNSGNLSIGVSDGGARGVCYALDDDDSGLRNLTNTLRIAYSSVVEYQPGYPRNEANTVDMAAVTIPTNSLKVFNDSAGKEIVPTGGWYLVPPGAKARIVKTLRTPTLLHRIDNDVANLTTFSSYAERSLDKSTTWNIDTSLRVTRVIDPGDTSKISSQTQVVQNYGNGIQSYTISR